MKPAEFASGRKSAVSHPRAGEPDSPRAWRVGFVVFGITYNFGVVALRIDPRKGDKTFG